MKKTGLIVLVVLLAVVLLHGPIIGAIAKPIGQKVASDMLGVPVKISRISVSIIPGHASVHGLKIASPEGFTDRNWLDLGHAGAKFNLLGLLFTKNLHLGKVYVKDLDLFVERKVDGDKATTNIEKVLSNLPVPQEATAPETTEEPKEEKGELPFSISVGKVLVRNIDIRIEDKTLGDGLDYEINDLFLEMKNLKFPHPEGAGLSETFDFNALLGVQNPSKVSLQGETAFLRQPVPNFDLMLNLEPLALTDLRSALKNSPIVVEEGRVDAGGSMKLIEKEIAVDMVVNLQAMKLSTNSEKSTLTNAPLKTLLTGLNQLENLKVPVQYSQNIDEPGFVLFKPFRDAFLKALKEKLSLGLESAKKLAAGAKTQVTEVAGTATESAKKVTATATGQVSDIAGSATESAKDLASSGIKKISGLFGKDE